MTRRIFAHWFKDPTGDMTKDVFAEVECTSVRLYPGSGEEPADYAIEPVRFSLNDADLDPRKYPKLVSYVMEMGR